MQVSQEAVSPCPAEPGFLTYLCVLAKEPGRLAWKGSVSLFGKRGGVVLWPDLGCVSMPMIWVCGFLGDTVELFLCAGHRVNMRQDRLRI